MQIGDLVGLFDRDVFLKLACTDLWNATVTGFGMSRAVRLPSCSLDGCARSVRRWFPDEADRAAAMARIATLVNETEIFSDGMTDKAQRDAAFIEINDTPDIDAGEALLVVALQLQEDPSLLLTGDKRFIRALRKHHPVMFARIRSQLISFEGCVLKACEMDGTISVIERLKPAAACDSVIRLALGGNPVVSEQSFREALASYDPLRLDRD